MVKKAGAMFVAGALLFFLCAARAQETEKPLTNHDVASMVKSGLPESTILLAIQMAAQRGSVQFDTSPGALIELKKQGATEKILNAVLWAQPFGATPSAEKKRAEISVAPGLPSQPGVYHRSASGWVALHSFLLWPPMSAPGNVAVGFGRSEYGIALPEPHALLQVAETQPTFYVREPPSGGGWQLLQLNTREDHREIRVVSGDFFAPGTGFAASELRGVQFRALAGEVLTVQPVSGLEAGEYLLCTAVEGARQLWVCYEFGIALGSGPVRG